MSWVEAALYAWAGGLVGGVVAELRGLRKLRAAQAALRQAEDVAALPGDRERGVMPDTTPEGVVRGAVALRDGFAEDVVWVAGGWPLSIEQQAALIRMLAAGDADLRILLTDPLLVRLAREPSPGDAA